MGMYDVLNGEQIKFFDKPYIVLPDHFASSSLSFSGGSLNEYGLNDPVPYKTLWYNYGKDFNIIDFFPYEHDELIVHMIRNGKNIGIKTLDELTTSDLVYTAYNDHGVKMNIHSVKDIEDYLKVVEEINEIHKNNISRTANNKLIEYIHKNKGAPDFNEKYKELYYQSELESINNHKIIDSCNLKKERFFINDDNYEYERLGGLIEGLTNYVFVNMLKPNERFIVNDPRLEFLSGYQEMNELLKKEDFINEYFKVMDFNENDMQNLKNHLNKIIGIYENLQELKVTSSQFEGKLLVDIINGRYKDFYLKFNLMPYEDFDFSDWDICEYDIKEDNYDSFKKEIEDYVEQRLNEEGLER